MSVAGSLIDHEESTAEDDLPSRRCTKVERNKYANCLFVNSPAAAGVPDSETGRGLRTPSP